MGACRIRNPAPAARAEPRRNRRRLLRGFAALPPLALALGGCGFRLQGTYAALGFDTFHTGIAPDTAVGGDLRRALRASGVRILEQPDSAQVVLRVLAEGEEREITAFSTTGRPREYVLRLRMLYRISDARGRNLAPDAEIVLRRRLTVNDALGTYNSEEDALLFRDMRSDLVQQLVRRLASVRLPA
jgi:LPS-assembly lipoprotein